MSYVSKPAWHGRYLPFGEGEMVVAPQRMLGGRAVPARSMGMGAAGDIVSGSVIDTGFGTRADCSSWSSWALNTGCWSNSLAQWQAVAALATPPPPAAVPPAVVAGALSPGGVVTGVTDSTSAQAAIDAAIATAKAQQDAQNLAFFAALDAQNAAAAPDCSLWYSALNPACSSAPIPSWALIGGAVLGVVLIVKAVK